MVRYHGVDGEYVLGFQDYNNTIGDISVAAETWTTLLNNGQGAFTNLQYNTIPDLVDYTGTQNFTFSELNLGDSVYIRTDFTFTPQVNGATLEVRYQLGAGAGLYTLPRGLGSLTNGAGIPYRFVELSYIYMGDLNTRDNPGVLQVKCSEAGTVNYAGCAIKVVR